MQYIMTPYAKKIESLVWWEGAFSDNELDWLQEQAKNANDVAKVGQKSNTGGVNPDVRRSQLAWLNNTEDTSWVYEKLAHVIASLNAQYYGFDLTGFGEALQLTNYSSTDSGMYNWHQDYGSTISRKLSLVVQLSDPSQYEGGNLQLMTSSEPMTVRKQRGLVAVFPSYVLHQVTPVTQGSRQSLVAWISGPDFK